jgi:hypothetical protein
MTVPLFAIYGANGCGRGIMPLARAQLAQAGFPLIAWCSSMTIRPHRRSMVIAC